MYQLIGYRRFHSDKTNSDYCVATFITPLSARDKVNGFIGSKTEEVFLSPESEFFNYLKESHIGKNFDISCGLDGSLQVFECVEPAK